MSTRKYDECDANDVKALNEMLAGLTVDVYGYLHDRDEHLVGNLSYDRYHQLWVLTTYVMYNHVSMTLESVN